MSNPVSRFRVPIKQMKPPCAPSSSGNSQTCYSPQSLEIIAKALNRDKGRRVVPEEGNEVWSSLKRALQVQCNNERCWLEQPFLSFNDRIELNKHFRPKRPKEWIHNARAWLSNFDIDNVMRQYETKYPSFDFLGVVPVDFAQKLSEDRCIIQKFCEFDVSEFAKKGKTKLGAVINLDTHDQPGSHWVAFMIVLKGKNIGTYYYDSVARSPPRMVSEFLSKVVNQLRISNQKHNYRHNTVRRQYKNSECGVFCLLFLEEMLKGRKCFDTVCNSIPYDDDVWALREKYFDGVSDRL